MWKAGSQRCECGLQHSGAANEGAGIQRSQAAIQLQDAAGHWGAPPGPPQMHHRHRRPDPGAFPTQPNSLNLLTDTLWGESHQLNKGCPYAAQWSFPQCLISYHSSDGLLKAMYRGWMKLFDACSGQHMWNLWTKSSPSISGDQGLTGTLERSGAALEFSQMIPGPAQRIWGSLVFLLLNWQMSRDAPEMHPRVLKTNPIPGGILRGCQTLVVTLQSRSPLL